MVLARGSTLLDIHGVGPAGAARTLADVGDVGDVARFTDRNRFASWTGTAPWTPPPASRSGTGCLGPGTGG
jgi:transposase